MWQGDSGIPPVADDDRARIDSVGGRGGTVLFAYARGTMTATNFLRREVTARRAVLTGRVATVAERDLSSPSPQRAP
jgi:hypothetical protein